MDPASFRTMYVFAMVIRACSVAGHDAPDGIVSRGETEAFPYTICGDRFCRDGSQVFLHILDYQPLEPGQAITCQIRETRIRDDLRRFQAYQRGSDPVVLRVYPQPTTELPNRMPQSFYDGIRKLGFWIIRDIYLPDYHRPDATTNGQRAIDAVIEEVEAAGAMDLVFAWEIGNEFQAATPSEINLLENFLEAMCAYLKARMAEPGREAFSNWVTWAAWPPTDPLYTAGNPIRVSCLDYASFNVYSYDPERIRDHQAGPGTGRPYAGYLSALKACFPDKPLVVSEAGLPDSPSAVGQDQASLKPWYPAYRRGGLSGDQIAEGLADQYWDTRLSNVAGIAFFEWNDEWHKAGQPSVHDDDPEEYFGLLRFSTNAAVQARYKLQQETVRDLFTMSLPNDSLSLILIPNDTSLPSATRHKFRYR